MSFNHVEDQSGDEIVAEINVTPLTDIFLVLLIIFMVTSTALIQQGTPVNLPRAGAGAATGTGVVITATADRQLAVNGRPVAPTECGGVPELVQPRLCHARALEHGRHGENRRNRISLPSPAGSSTNH